MLKFAPRKSLSFLILFITLLSTSMTTIVQADTATSKVDIAKPTGPHEVPSQLCGGCHVEIYKEWQGSMHAQSSALKDPIHGAFYRKVMGDPTEEGVNKKGKYPVCLKCHAPNAAIQKKTKLDSKVAFNEGVNCVYCHTISGFKGTTKKNGKQRLGQSAYINSTTHLQAPSGKNYTTAPLPENSTAIDLPFHPFPMEGSNSAVYKSNQICMGCHDQRKNGNDVPLCATGDEYAASGDQVNCQSCHMPMVNGHSSHTWSGGHDKNMLRKALQLKMDIVGVKGDKSFKAKVVMKNMLPHKFPTGSPFRNAYLKLSAYNEKGETVWQNYQNSPFKEDKAAVMNYVLGDGQGTPAGPPKAKEVLSDSRLKPHEEKIMEYDISGAGITFIRAEVLYHLLTPKLVNKLDKVLTPDLKETKSVAIAEVAL